VHTRPIQLELQVHNLEDGGVVVQYNCECPELVERLKKIVQGYDKQVILAPYPSMKSRIALTAWTRIDTFDDFDERRVRRFIDSYRGIAPHRWRPGPRRARGGRLLAPARLTPPAAAVPR